MTEKTYHFISGLPRSGSTLLSSILSQNPRIHTSISDSLASLTKNMIENIQDSPGMKSEVPVERRKNTVKGTFDGFYKHIDKPIIFNTNRLWTLMTPQVKGLYPNAKIIVCVRDINSILDSFENAHRKNPFSTNTVTGNLDGSVYSRVDMLMSEKGVVGFPYLGLKQAITSNERNMLMLVEYEQLCKNPALVVNSIYNFIGEEKFEHDFNNVEASWDEYDAEIGIPLHKVRKKVEYIPRQPILPPDILAKYTDMEVWRGR